MNNATKRGLKVAIIVIALLLTIALGVGVSTAWYTATRKATGIVKLNSGIAIQYKGFGAEDVTSWNRDAEGNAVTGTLTTINRVKPGDQIAVTPGSDVRLTKESVDAYLRVKISYKFYATTESTTAFTSEELTAAKETFKASDLITMQDENAFFGENFTKSGDYYYYTTTSNGDTLKKVGHATDNSDTTTGFVNLFATDAKFVIEGKNFVGADEGEGKGYVVKAAVLDESGNNVQEPAVVISKIEIVLDLEFIQATDGAVSGWEISKTA